MIVIQHVTEAIKRLITQYKGLPNIEGIVTILAQQTQNNETVYHALLNERALSTAIGAQLDIIGEIVGVLRSGQTDSEYRGRITVQIAQNNSEGTPDDLIRIFDALLNPSEVEYNEIYPAEFSLFGLNPNPLFPSVNVAEAIRGAKPAGVGSGYIASGFSPVFAFEGNVGDPDEAGFGDAGFPLVGGNFATLI